MHTSIFKITFYLYLTTLLPTFLFGAISQTAHAQHNVAVIFGGDAEYPPFEWQEKNHPYGFNIDLEDTIVAIGQAKAIHKLGNWPEMIQALEDGTIDVLPMFVSESRQEKFIFTSPFHYVSHAIYALSDVKKVSSLDALSGQRLVVETNSYAHDRISSEQPNVSIVLANNTLDALKIIEMGKAEYAVLAISTATRLINDNRLNIARVGPPFWPRGYAFAVRKDRPELANWLEDSLNLAIGTGAYNQVYQNWKNELEPSQTSIWESLRISAIILIPLILLAIFGYIWSWSLRRTVDKRTKQLNEELELRKAAEAEIKYMASYDELTGLPKYHHMIELANTKFQKQSLDSQIHMELVIMKLAETEMITRVFGHSMEEAFINAFANRLKTFKFEVCGYVGRGVFTIVCYKNQFIHYLDGLTAQIMVNDIGLYPQVIGGIACWPVHADKAEELGRKAETALAVCLERNHNWAVYDDDMEPDKVDLHIVTEFRKTNGVNLHIVLQPQIDLKTGRVIGAEALVRWQSDKLGTVPPSKFIPLLEKAGLISLVTNFMLDEAIRIASKLRAINQPCTISVNVSAKDLQSTHLLSNIHHALARHKAMAGDVKLELTETAIADKPEQVRNVLDSLYKMGIYACIDDFGTGYSSLSYLSSYPIREIKIDQVFVRDIVRNHRHRSIVRSTIAMAHALNMTVVAEGAEDTETLAILTNNDCDSVQGYVVSAPLSEDDFIEFMTRSADHTS